MSQQPNTRPPPNASVVDNVLSQVLSEDELEFGRMNGNYCDKLIILLLAKILQKLEFLHQQE